MSIPYILPKGQVDLKLSVSRVNFSAYDADVGPPMRSHDFSLKLYTSPWIVLPLASHDIISKIEIDDPSRLVNLVEREKIVRNVLSSNDISQRLWDASSGENRACWAQDQEDPKMRETMPYFCFNGAEYIASLWITDDPLRDPISLEHKEVTRFTTLLAEVALEQLHHLYGAFFCNMVFDIESHGFVIYLDQTNITIYNTYGGVIGVFIVTYDRKSWIEAIIKFASISIKEQLSIYGKLFGFHPHLPVAADRYLKDKRQIKFKSLKMSRLL